jgi:hypothetical protein
MLAIAAVRYEAPESAEPPNNNPPGVFLRGQEIENSPVRMIAPPKPVVTERIVPPVGASAPPPPPTGGGKRDAGQSGFKTVPI